MLEFHDFLNFRVEDPPLFLIIEKFFVATEQRKRVFNEALSRNDFCFHLKGNQFVYF